MARSKSKKNPAAIIAALGGPHVVARRLGLKDPRVVWNWRHRGFPPDSYWAMAQLLQARRMQAPPELWGMRKLVRR